MSKNSSVITAIRPAGDNHQVVSVAINSDRKNYRRTPCGGCPWKKQNDGSFPAQAFSHSAETAYDMSSHVFACHESGVKKGHTCAGFLLNGADHNLSVRLGYAKGNYKGDVHAAGADLHPSYRSMAIANGMDPKDPVLKLCRP